MLITILVGRNARAGRAWTEFLRYGSLFVCCIPWCKNTNLRRCSYTNLRDRCPVLDAIQFEWSESNGARVNSGIGKLLNGKAYMYAAVRKFQLNRSHYSHFEVTRHLCRRKVWCEGFQHSKNSTQLMCKRLYSYAINEWYDATNLRYCLCTFTLHQREKTDVSGLQFVHMQCEKLVPKIGCDRKEALIFLRLETAVTKPWMLHRTLHCLILR